MSDPRPASIQNVEVKHKPARSQQAGNQTRTTFEEWTARVTRSGKCPVCGKRTRRAMSFGRTVNPWNKGADGAPRTSEQVRDQVVAAAEAWEPTRHQMSCVAHPFAEVCSAVGHTPRPLSPHRCSFCSATIEEVAP